jgi:pyruvate/2-oxoglutarate/acetoin dehydrogenase E1 component
MITYAQSINKALDEKLGHDKNVVLFGEDVCDPYGGAFKVTKGLSTKHPGRVINTPMSEYALTGVASGLAMSGMRPILEIMFGDFITICADQLINHAAKFSWMYNSQVKVPMVIRTPMGGRRGYGPTHSQTIEKMFLGIPGLKVIAPSHFHDPGKELINAIEDNNPILFIEHKLLYAKKIGELKDGYIFDFAVKKSRDKFETLTLSNNNFEGADVTVLAYGGMLPWVLEAVNEKLVEAEITSEIVVPSYINDASIAEVLESLKKLGDWLLQKRERYLMAGGQKWPPALLKKVLNCWKLPSKGLRQKICRSEIPD